MIKSPTGNTLELFQLASIGIRELNQTDLYALVHCYHGILVEYIHITSEHCPAHGLHLDIVLVSFFS